MQDSSLYSYCIGISGGGDLGVYCYGVNVNNASNDGTPIPASYAPVPVSPVTPRNISRPIDGPD